MNLDLNEEQRILTNAAREFLRKECPRDLLRQVRDADTIYAKQLWQQMAELGWMGLAIPERFGGSGGNLVDLNVLVEAMGEACLPAPFFSTVVVTATALQLADSEKLQMEFLPKIAAGELIATLALIEPGNTYGVGNIQTSAEEAGDGYILNGTKLFVEYAEVADYLLTVARVKGKGLAVLMLDTSAHGIEMTALPTLDYAGQCEVRLTNVKVAGDRLLALGANAEQLMQGLEEISAVSKCAEMVGCIQTILEICIDYVKVREQFGQPIGSFQAVQHHCANMAVEVDCSRYITRLATWKISQGLPASKEASMAKSYTSDAAVRIAKLGHQTHGAISFCDEHDMHLLLRKAHAASIAFGDSEYHLEKVAQQIGL